MIPTPHELEPCPNGCGALVLWTTTEHGRQMAVDAEPHEAGNQACFKDGPGRWRSRSLNGTGARAPEHVEDTFKPHVATCTKRQPVQRTLPGLVLAGGASPRSPRPGSARRRSREIS